MDPGERHEAILDLLRRRGAVGVEELAARFGLSTQSIRADLNALAEQGLAVRTHGGARRAPTVTSRDYAERRRLRAAEKRAIGKAAAALIPEGCSVMLNIGTTTEEVARALSGHEGLTVISNNINIMNLMMDSRARELVMAGGAVRRADGAVIGEDAVEFVSRYKADYAVIGASALDEDGAVLDFDAREVAVARAILRNARRRILVSDASKFEVNAPVRICALRDLDHVVTDRAPPPAFVAAARAGGARITIAEIQA